MLSLHELAVIMTVSPPSDNVILPRSILLSLATTLADSPKRSANERYRAARTRPFGELSTDACNVRQVTGARRCSIEKMLGLALDVDGAGPVWAM